MISTLAIAVGALALFLAFGVSVVAWLPDWCRDALLPALPLVGAMALVVGLHATTLVMSVHFGVLALAAIAVVTVVLRSWRVHWWRHLGGVRWLAAALLAGALPFVWVTGAARATGPTLVAPTSGDDAFSYITVSDWLLDHPATLHPDPSRDSPAWGYTHVHLDVGLRIGEELDQAAVATITGVDPQRSWYMVMAVWLLLLPGSCLAAAALLGIGRLVGLMGGFLGACSAVVGFQVLNANSAAILGISMLPLSLACFARCIDALADGNARPAPPFWLVAGMVAALVGTYTEYLPVVGLGIVVFVAGRRPAEGARALLAALRVAALAVAMAPLVWYDAARSLLVTTTLGDTGRISPFLGPPLVAISHFTGNRGALVDQGTKAALPFAALFGVGLIAAAMASPARRFVIAFTSSIAVTVIYLSFVRRLPYQQERAVEVSIALLTFFSVAGVAWLIQLLGRHSRMAANVALAGGVIAGAGLVFVNHRATAAIAVGMDPARRVDADFRRAVDWLQQHAGADGSSGMVVSGDHFDQLWLMYATRDLTRLHYPFVYQDYGGVAPLHYNDGVAHRYAVVDSGTFLDADPKVVVGGNSRFRYLDLSRGQAVIAIGVKGFLRPEPTPAGPRQWMINDGQLMVVHTPGIPRAGMSATSYPAASPEQVVVSTDGRPGPAWTVTASGGRIDIALPDAITVVLIHNLVPAAPVGPDNAGMLSIRIVEVRRASG